MFYKIISSILLSIILLNYCTNATYYIYNGYGGLGGCGGGCSGCGTGVGLYGGGGVRRRIVYRSTTYEIPEGIGEIVISMRSLCDQNTCADSETKQQILKCGEFINGKKDKTNKLLKNCNINSNRLSVNQETCENSFNKAETCLLQNLKHSFSFAASRRVVNCYRNILTDSMVSCLRKNYPSIEKYLPLKYEQDKSFKSGKVLRRCGGFRG